MNAGVDCPPGFQSHSGGSTEDKDAETPNQTKIKPVPMFLGLTRCASCYNQKKFRSRRGSWDGESSSSAEDSGPDPESDVESSSSSSSSLDALSETQEKCETENPPPEQVETAEPESGGKTETEGTPESTEDKGAAKSGHRRAPLIKSYSLPSTFPPHLIPWSHMPRPPTVVSTLRLQVLSQEQADDPLFVIQPHLSEQAEEHHGQIFNSPPYPLTPTMNRLPWQQRSLPSLQQHQPPYQQPPPELSHQQSTSPQFEPPLTQMFPPAAQTLPVLHPKPLYPPLHTPHTHLHAPPPQLCWYCYSMQNPYTL